MMAEWAVPVRADGISLQHACLSVAHIFRHVSVQAALFLVKQRMMRTPLGMH